MKSVFILVFISLMSLQAHATRGTALKSKVAAFLEKGGQCELATTYISNLKVPGQTKDDPAISNSVLCVADLTLNEGTIHEQNGCGVVIFSGENGRYYPPDPWFPPIWGRPLLEGVACSDGGFQKLMEMKMNFDGKQLPVREIMKRKAILSFPMTVVYSKRPEYVDYYEGKKPVAKSESASGGSLFDRAKAALGFGDETSSKEKKWEEP